MSRAIVVTVFVDYCVPRPEGREALGTGVALITYVRLLETLCDSDGLREIRDEQEVWKKIEIVLNFFEIGE